MTKQEAAIITAYTGYFLGEFSDFHEYAQSILGRSIWTHEFGVKETMQALQEASAEDFLNLEVK